MSKKTAKRYCIAAGCRNNDRNWNHAFLVLPTRPKDAERMTTYSINLDDVDLALLPMRVRTNHFLEKQYFHFSVMKEDALPDTSHIYYTCHTCAIEVPAAFASEHIASIKHRANARIADVAMQRTRAIISSHPIPSARSTKRFCTNCATVIDEDHEKTKDHRVAAMHDNLLWELMKAYAGDDESNDHDINKKKSKDEDESKAKDKKDGKEFKNDNNNNDTATVQTVKQDLQKAAEMKTDYPQPNCENNKQKLYNDGAITMDDGVQNVNSINAIAKQSTNHVVTTSQWVKLPQNQNVGVNKNGAINTVKKDTESTESIAKNAKDNYEKELRKFIDINNSYELKEMYNRIHIKRNDEILNVYSDHFHSYHRLYAKNNDVECIVCNSTLQNKDAEAHKYDLNHMSIVAKIGNDSHYVREINETYSHCILCNQKINNANVATHKTSNHHIVRKGNNVKINKIKEKTTNTTGNQEIEELGVSPYEEKRGELWCLVCECRVPRDLRNRKDHLKGARHLSNMK